MGKILYSPRTLSESESIRRTVVMDIEPLYKVSIHPYIFLLLN